jgi:cytochrome P450
MLPNEQDGHMPGVAGTGEPQPLLFDPRRADAFTNPYRMFQRLRAQDPIHYRPGHDDWVLTRYADVAAVLSDNRFGFGETAGSQPASVSQEQANVDQPRRALQQFHRQVQYLSRLWLGERKPPEHTRMRRQLQRALAPYATAQFRRRIQAMTHSVLDRQPGAGSLDAVAELASLVPTAVMAEILGVPSQEYANLQRWFSRLACMVDLDISSVAKAQGRVALLGLIEYSRTLLAERRLRPGPDLMSALIRDQQQGHLSPDEVLITCALLPFVGYETTRHLIAMSLLSLLQHPDQLLHLQREPPLIAQAVEECLRYDSPAQHIRRMALTDVDLGGG